MFPELIELLLIGCSIELICTLKSKYIDTKNQLADISTKGNLTRDEWNHFLSLFYISHFSFHLLCCNGEAISTRIRTRKSHSRGCHRSCCLQLHQVHDRSGQLDGLSPAGSSKLEGLLTRGSEVHRTDCVPWWSVMVTRANSATVFLCPHGRWGAQQPTPQLRAPRPRLTANPAKVISAGTVRRFNLLDHGHARLCACPTGHSGHRTRTSHR